MWTMHFFALIFGTAIVMAAAPAITGVYNAGSWIPPSLPNSGVAQGAYFTVTGSGLGPSTLLVAPSYPLPTTQGLGGTVVQVKVGAVTQTCIMYYTSATQVSGIVPSATPVGSGTLTISYQGGSASATIQVVAASFGMFTLNSGGTGPASITDVSYNPITMIHVAHPGDTLVLWGTGLGAVTGDETEPPTPANFPGVEVLIENQLVTPSYAGRSSYPGLDQINVVVPAGTSGGCKTSIAVVVNGVTGNVVSTSIGPAGQTVCGDTYGALTAANLEKAAASGSLNIGAVDVSRIGTNDDVLAASFATYPVNSLIRSYAGSYGPSIGGCVVYEQVASGTLILTDPVLAGLPHLDPGPSLVLTPQAGKAVTVNATSTGVFGATLGTTGDVYISPGTYSVANGNGGSDVGAFNWSDTLPNPVAFGNLPTSVSRALNLTVSWTGSSPFTLVTIFGYSAVPLSTTENSYVEFVCTAPASSTQFTIPSSIMSLLPVDGYGALGVQGVGFQIAGVVDNRFTAAGLDAGQFSVFTSAGPVVKVQ
jgi:uncharacterized protein (TIGR03437 family)